MIRFRFPLFVVTILMVLLLSAMNVAPALADDSTPPPTEPAVSDGIVDEEAPPVSEEQTSPVESLLEQLPEDTTLIVVGEDGESLPLASQAAAEAILTASDPQWCPVGVTPGSATCSGVKDSFNGANATTDLIQWLINNPKSVAGVIWIEASYVGTNGLEGGPVTLSGYELTSMSNYALTINGGWTGTGTTLNPNTPSEFNVPFAVIGWNAPVTINNLLITGVSGDFALGIGTNGNVTVNNVDVQGNVSSSAANISSSGNVVVNDSTFNDNTGLNATGLSIYSNNGTVTLKNITANGNTYDGVSIYNIDATTPKAVTLTGSNQFIGNGRDGLKVVSKGVITLSNVTAMYNGRSGAYLDNCFYNGNDYYCDLGVASGMILKGTSNFSGNGWDGLRILSGGAITINNITANDNGWDSSRPGVTYGHPDDYNAYGKGVSLINYGAVTQLGITLTGTNTFNGNASNGLFALSYGGIKVNNITANQNGCDPLKDTDPGYCAGAYLEAYLGVTQTGYGIFVGNEKDGLIVGSFYKGAVSLTNLTADLNDRYGVIIWGFGMAPVNVTISGFNFFTNNSADGLNIQNDGTVTLSNLTAIGNNGTGVSVINQYASTPRPVVINGAATFNDNNGDGLYIFSQGAITTNGVTAIGNNGYGAYLDNCDFDGYSTCLVSAAAAVLMKGSNFFDVNTFYGLAVYSRGAITISNLTSTYNSDGVMLDNNYSNAVGGVTITGFANTSSNYASGLTIYSSGSISLANVTANNNDNGYGAYIGNSVNPVVSANVTISGTNTFNGNGASGLVVLSYGVVSLNNITANYNGNPQAAHGAYINNNVSDLGTAARAVKLTGVNTFNGNYATGLFIQSLGAISVSKVTANYNLNGGSGVKLDNQYDKFSQPVTIIGYGIFNDNATATQGGLFIDSNGLVTTSNLTANGNGGNGVYIETYSLTTTPALQALSMNVTLLGVNTFNNNGLDGLGIISDGQVTLNNITANNNGASGVHVDNDLVGGGSVNKNLVLNGWNTFMNNGGDGLFFYITGSAILNRIVSGFNNDGVADSYFSAGIYGIAGGTINLTCSNLYANEGYGYFLQAGGLVTLKGVFSYSNGSGNSASGTPSVTRTCPLP